MSFASPQFLWFFMPATLLGYWSLPARSRNALVAAVSLLFYTWGAGAFAGVLLACIAVNYGAGIAIETAPDRARRAVLLVAVSFDVAVLAVWKYAGFATQQVAALSAVLGLHSTPVVDLALPIGISFFTFHHISYVVDVYRRSRPALRRPVTFVTYIAMFPQLVAGPIVRFHEIADQLGDVRRDRMADFAAGFPRFAIGLAKKVVVADQIAPIADASFAAASDGDVSSLTAWIGALAYAVQIYFDFSGYSDMAIGLGRMFGFRLPENFSRPYSAVSVTDFWRRWHMSLSRWFRDYVYVPLGGNRAGTVATYRNLGIVFVLTGFWHGAAWTFLVWGLYHGAWLIVERATGLGRDPRRSGRRGLHRAVTFGIVLVGWVFFRAPDLGVAARMLRAMVVPAGGGLGEAVAVSLTHQRTTIFLLALLVVLLPAGLTTGQVVELAGERARTRASEPAGRRVGLPARTVRLGAVFVAAPLSAVLVAAGTFSPFLYFQF